jgi:hypothetical protein
VAIAVLLGLTALASHLLANSSQHVHPSYSACGETICNVTVTTSTKQLLKSQWRRLEWLLTGTQKFREGNIRYYDIERQGPVSLHTKTSQYHDEIRWGPARLAAMPARLAALMRRGVRLRLRLLAGWLAGWQPCTAPADAPRRRPVPTRRSIEAWVQLNDDLSVLRETTVVAFGPFSLQLKAPGTPQLLIRPTATTFDAGYRLYRDSRGNCGNLELVNSQTASIIEAARVCTVTPGARAGQAGAGSDAGGAAGAGTAAQQRPARTTPIAAARRRLQRRDAAPGLRAGLVLQGRVRRHRGA